MNPGSGPQLTYGEMLRLVTFMAERGHRRDAYELLTAAITPRLLEALTSREDA